MGIKESLKELMLLPAPSGYEGAVAQMMYDRLAIYGDEVSVDRPGNVIARFTGSNTPGPKIMVYAHMDQIGFIVRMVEPNGFLRLERLGGIPEKVLPAIKLKIRTDDGRWILGVISSKSHHITPPEEKYKTDRIQDLYVDIGAENAEQVSAMGIGVGNPAVYEPCSVELGNGILSGTSIDNRGGCAVLLHTAAMLAEGKAASEVYLVGTVQEEFNLRGAMLAARSVKPDIAIALDVTLTGDTPDLKNYFSTKLGGGPVVSLYNFHGRGTLNGSIAHNGLANLVFETAKEYSIPIQRFASTGILTDSAYVQLEGEGIASIDLGFPTRYTHTPVETCSVSDLEHLSELLYRLLRNISKEFSFNRYEIKRGDVE